MKGVVATPWAKMGWLGHPILAERVAEPPPWPVWGWFYQGLYGGGRNHPQALGGGPATSKGPKPKCFYFLFFFWPLYHLFVFCFFLLIFLFSCFNIFNILMLSYFSFLLFFNVLGENSYYPIKLV
jgi:hypothetical protein